MLNYCSRYFCWHENESFLRSSKCLKCTVFEATQTLNYHKLYNLRNLPLSNKISKVLSLHLISANSDTCGSDARIFVASTIRLEVALTVCCNLGIHKFKLPKIGGGSEVCRNFRSLVIIYF